MEASLKKMIKMSTLRNFLPQKILLTSHNKQALCLKCLLNLNVLKD